MMTKKMMTTPNRWNFIDKYIELMSHVTDAPTEFQKAAALFLISTCASRRFTIISAAEHKFFDDYGASSGKYLNLWYILVGKTRISRKSTVVSRVEEFIEHIDRNLFLRHSFTPQALIRELNNMDEDGHLINVRGTIKTWVHDEISGFFEQLTTADYMASVDSMLSRLYDGRNYTSSTISRGAVDIKDPYITCFLASTEYLPSLFTENQIRQGFLNRFIFVHGKRITHKPMHEYDVADNISAGELLHWLKALYDISSVMVVVERAAQKFYDNFEIEIENKIQQEEGNLEEGYYGNMPNVMIRVAALHKIARLEIEEIAYYTSNSVVIELEDMIWAKDYVNECMENFREILSMMSSNAISKRSFTEERRIEHVYSIIPETGITRTDLYRKSHLLSKDLEEIVSTLVQQDRIEQSVNTATAKAIIMYKKKTSTD